MTTNCDFMFNMSVCSLWKNRTPKHQWAAARRGSVVSKSVISVMLFLHFFLHCTQQDLLWLGSAAVTLSQAVWGQVSGGASMKHLSISKWLSQLGLQQYCTLFDEEYDGVEVLKPKHTRVHIHTLGTAETSQLID